jgi:hypothetical protein
MLYEPTRFDALIDEPWVPARVEDAIAAIVADAGAAFDPTALWPPHEWDAREKPLPLSGLYVGAAGVIWALDELQRRGHAESSRDLVAAAARAVELERATPDFAADEHYRPGALMSGETGARRLSAGGSKRTLSLGLHLTCICRAQQAHTEEGKPREQRQVRGALRRTIAEDREEHAAHDRRGQ